MLRIKGASVNYQLNLLPSIVFVSCHYACPVIYACSLSLVSHQTLHAESLQSVLDDPASVVYLLDILPSTYVL